MFRNLALVLLLATLPLSAAENVSAFGPVARANISAIGPVAIANVSAIGAVDNTSSANIVADFWQTFEFTTWNAANLDSNDGVAGNNWTVAGTGLSTSTSGEKALLATVNSVSDSGHTRGMAWDWTVTGASYGLFVFPSAPNAAAVSYAAWVKVPNSADETPVDIFTARDAGGDNVLFTLRLYGKTPRIIGTSTVDYGTVMTADTWYWFTWKVQRNATSGLTIYNDSGAIVGTAITVTANDFNQGMLSIGSVNSITSQSMTFYMDDLLYDTTDATYPLGPE